MACRCQSLRQNLTVVDSFDISTQAPTNSSNQSLLFPGIKSTPCAALCLEFQLLLDEVSEARNMTPQFEQAQFKAEERQRICGIIPNFYVFCESDLAPVTAKMKSRFALKVSTDPVSAVGVALVSASRQAANSPDYWPRLGRMESGRILPVSLRHRKDPC